MPLSNVNRPVLYSTMTKLAYNINKQYYNDLHYMWCTPYFGTDYNAPIFTVPPSSSPMAIYQTIKNEVEGSDFHDTKLKQNRIGIRRGARIKLDNNLITSVQYDEIIEISKSAKDIQLMPLLCIIPKIEAVPYVKEVKIHNKANPLSKEFILIDLPSSAFDIIRI